MISTLLTQLPAIEMFTAAAVVGVSELLPAKAMDRTSLLTPGAGLSAAASDVVHTAAVDPVVAAATSQILPAQSPGLLVAAVDATGGHFEQASGLASTASTTSSLATQPAPFITPVPGEA